MRDDRGKAVRLRLQGKSYSEIQKTLDGISKSTLSAWLKGVVLSDAPLSRLRERTREKSLRGLLRRNRLQTVLAVGRRNERLKLAKAEIKHISLDNLFYIGLALYWAEGYKRPIIKNNREVTFHPISLTNSDPKLVRIFIEFLIRICKVLPEKIKASVRIFQHLNESNALNYWSKTTGIPLKNFTKTYVGTSRSSMGKRPFNRLPYGIIQIRMNDTSLFHRIIGWIEGLKSKF